MATVYRVYLVEKNQFLTTHRDKREAIADADSLAGLDHVTGEVQVHELEEDDVSLVRPVVVYRCRG